MKLRATVAQIAAAMAVVLMGFTSDASSPESMPPDPSQGMSIAVDSTAAQPVAILYYFHRTLRCETCLMIETYIDEALRVHYADALEDGRLQWLPMNIEEPGNAHFEEDFSLEYNSAILVHLDGQRSVSWRNLEKVWDLVEDKEGFVAYIRDQIQPLLSPDDK
jgi:hypothetical protein